MAYTSEGTTGGKEVTFEIKQGEGLKVIAENLKQQGLIKNKIAFILKAKDMGVDVKSQQTIPWVNSNKKFIKSMFKNILTPMENAGVDFWWLDWQQGLYDSKVKNLSN